MSKDSSHTYIHFSQPRIADLFEVSPHQLTTPLSPSIFAFPKSLPFPPYATPPAHTQQEFTRPPHLPPEPIYVAPHHQPPNPEDEDDVVPDQHAAFGIQRATQAKREVAWRDLGLQELMERGPNWGKVRQGGMPR
ncbi:MAG: hypothetical protein L6R42_006064 [Xanthoria sp. 1 TBL-2021]|nr:MAG: hypothetical protein L6R42_006064 [Xanthoria sp. 1 TBL-2021]